MGFYLSSFHESGRGEKKLSKRKRAIEKVVRKKETRLEKREKGERK